MGNVKLTKEQIYALKQTKFYYGSDKYQKLILDNYLVENLTSLEYEDMTFLYDFDIEEVMNILLGNYELKKDGIELVREEFYKVKSKLDKTDEEKGYLTGISFAVKNLGFRLRD